MLRLGNRQVNEARELAAGRKECCCKIAIALIDPIEGVLSANAFYEKVIKVKADVAAFLINCFPSA
jgi:hypothetical protein